MAAWLIWLIAAVAAVIVFALAMWKQYRNVGPNEVLIISGGRQRSVVDPDGTKKKIGYRMQIGGGTFVFPFIESAQTLSFDIYTLDFKAPEVLTSTGVPVITEGLAQIKVKSDEYSIRQAAEQFLGKGPGAMQDVARQILEGHMRSVIGSMTVEEMYQNRQGFSDRVSETVADEFERMGLQLISFALKDLTDTQGYLDALGRPQIAAVKRDAMVAQAETDRDAIIKSAAAKKEGEIAKFKADTEVAEAHRNFESKRAEFQAAINQKKAAADVAYDLEKLRQSQELKTQEAQIRLIEKEKAIEIEKREIARREHELDSSVKKTADAQKYQIQAEAEARAQAMRVEGEAEVELMRAKGAAQSAGMKEKAEAWRQYNEAAIYQMFIDVLPQVARAVSEPLSKVDKITLIGNGGGGGASKITGEVTNILAQMPEVLESLTGVDIKEMLRDLPAMAKSRAAKKSEKTETGEK
jgi:flotillin